jgi:hypothetical protein
VAYRSYEYADMAANACGVLLGLGLAGLLPSGAWLAPPSPSR